MILKKTLIACMTTLLLSSCGHSIIRSSDEISNDNYHGYYKVGEPYKIDGEWYYPSEQPEYDQTGVASWYGSDFHGKKTANGDTYDKNSLTAAHNTLPLPSMVRVTNLENNKTLILMVNDRGPFSKGRVIDVSERASQILGFRDKGIAKVRVQFLEGQTKRLLADLPKKPEEKKGLFAFLGKGEAAPAAIAEPEVPVGEVYADSSDSSAPVDIMPADNAVSPVTQLSNMLKSGEGKTASASASKKPDINIAQTEIQENEVSPQEEYVAESQEDSEDIPIAEDTAKVSGEVVEKDLEVIKPAEVAKVETKDEIADVPPALDAELKKEDEEEVAFIDKEPVFTSPVIEKEMHFIQAGTYGMMDNATRAERVLKPLGDVDIKPVKIGGKTLYRVRLGPIKEMGIAKLALDKVIKMGHADAMLVSDMVPVQN